MWCATLTWQLTWQRRWPLSTPEGTLVSERSSGGGGGMTVRAVRNQPACVHQGAQHPQCRCGGCRRDARPAPLPAPLLGPHGHPLHRCAPQARQRRGAGTAVEGCPCQMLQHQPSQPTQPSLKPSLPHCRPARAGATATAACAAEPGQATAALPRRPQPAPPAALARQRDGRGRELGGAGSQGGLLQHSRLLQRTACALQGGNCALLCGGPAAGVPQRTTGWQHAVRPAQLRAARLHGEQANKLRSEPFPVCAINCYILCIVLLHCTASIVICYCTASLYCNCCKCRQAQQAQQRQRAERRAPRVTAALAREAGPALWPRPPTQAAPSPQTVSASQRTLQGRGEGGRGALVGTSAGCASYAAVCATSPCAAQQAPLQAWDAPRHNKEGPSGWERGRWSTAARALGTRPSRYRGENTPISKLLQVPRPPAGTHRTATHHSQALLAQGDAPGMRPSRYR